MKIAFGIASLIVIFSMPVVFGSESAGFEDQDLDNDINFSGFLGPLINCETFSYEIPITVHSQSSVSIIIEIIDPDGNVAGRDEFKSDNYERNRIIEMNWGKDGRYLIQVHFKGEIYQEDFSYNKRSPENYQGWRMACLKQEYIESVRDETWTWFNFLTNPSQDGFIRNIKIADELIRESDSIHLRSIVSEKNINMTWHREKRIDNLEEISVGTSELKSLLPVLVEQKVITVFQTSESQLMKNTSISLEEKTELIFELRKERDSQIQVQKRNAENYASYLSKFYESVKERQDIEDSIADGTHPRIRQEMEEKAQIQKEKESIKQEILSQKQSRIPEWVKNNVKWWSENQIDDETFVSGIQFLMKEKIVNIPNLPEQASEKARLSFVDESKDTQSYIDRYNNEPDYKDWFDENYPDYTIYEAVGVTEPVPRWIKNNADWWSQGLITEDEFIKGIEYMVKEGIIKV